MSTLSDSIARQAEEQAKAKKKKSSKKRDENGKFVKTDESQNSNLCPSYRRWSVWYPQGERIQKLTHRKSNRNTSRKKTTY